MPLLRYIGTLVLTAGLLGSALAPAAPLAIGYGGRLTSDSGAPVSGPVELKVRFFDAATDGKQLGADVDAPGVVLNGGVFQLSLALDATAVQAVFGGGAAWIEVTDVTNRKTYPRQTFNAVPYALRVPVDGNSITYDNSGALTVPAPAAIPQAGSNQPGLISASDWTAFNAKQNALTSAGASATGYLTSADWAQFNGAAGKTYVDGLNTSQTANLAALSSGLTTTNTNLTAITNAALKKDGSVPLTNTWNVGNQDVTNTGSLTMAGSKVFGLSVATSDPANLTAGDIGKIWYNGGIKLWNGTSAQSLGIAGAGLMAINSLNAGTQTLANAVTGTTPAWNSAGSTHTLNIPMANTGGTVTAGLISNAEWILFNGKQNVLPAANAVTNGYLSGGDWTVFNAKQALLPPGSLTANGYLASADWASFNAKQNALGAATGGGAGYLTAGDWSTFNGREPAVPAGSTAQYYRGDKTWQTLATGAVAEAGNLYYTTVRAQADARIAIGAGAPLSYNAGTGAVSLPPATFTANGYLASADWAVFNAKQGAAGNANAGTAGFLSSADWAAFNAKQPAGSYVATTRNVNTNAPLTGGGSLASDLTLNLAQATVGGSGYLSSADWALFNAKDQARTTGALTEATSNILTISGGAGSVIGAGTTIAVTKATAAAHGYLASGDWSSFNGRVSKAGDTMSGSLTLPVNGLAVGSNQIVTTGGNVGIGTTNPSTALQVNGTVTATQFVGGGTGRMLGIYASGAAVSNYSIVFTGAPGSSPSLAGSTLTLPSNTLYMTVEIWGAGGGGGADDNVSNTPQGSGAGGGAGGYALKYINNPAGTYYYTIGGGGGAGAAGNPGGSGGAGGTTCFGTSATACTAPIMSAAGGGGGGGGANSPANNASGGAGGAGTGGDLNLAGAGGNIGVYGNISNAYMGTGSGGSAPLGGGGGYGGGANGSGGNGGAFGGGGGGGAVGGGGGIKIMIYQ